MNQSIFNPASQHVHVIPMTPIDQEHYDPSGKARQKLSSYKEGRAKPIPLALRKFSREGWMNEYVARRNRCIGQNHILEREYDDAHMTKYGAQGASFPLSELLKGYANSYDLAHSVRDFRGLLIGRDVLIRMIRQTISRVGYPQEVQQKVKPTLAGLPTMLKKDMYQAQTIGHVAGYGHVWPTLPGERDQRTKHRGINLDSVINVNMIQPILDKCRNWLKKWFPEFFDGWICPRLFLQPSICKTLAEGFVSIETDFEKCDEHFSLELVINLILPIYETLLGEMEFVRFASTVEELFHQPLYLGDALWTGLHNAFSGQSVVSDFETIFDVILALASLIPRVGWRKWTMHCIGDDISICVKADERTTQGIYDAMIDLSNQAGMVIARQKSQIRRGSVAFCRRLYTPQQKKLYNEYGLPYSAGAYPGILWLNSIINPERFATTMGDNMVATIQRSDNFFGSAWYTPMIQWLFSTINREHLAEYRNGSPEYDWWETVYGETWSLANSPTLTTLINSGILPKF